MRKTLWATILCLCLLLGGAQALAAENLLVNSGFEEAADGKPVGWKEDMWLYEAGVSYLELREGGRSGSWCALVENVVSNDARFIQTVAVEPHTVYKLSGWVKAEQCDTNFAGASLSVIGSFATFPELHDTAGEWVYMESLVRTADGQEELVIGARLGDYSADNTGKAYFDDLFFGKADETPPGVQVIPLTDYSGYEFQQQTETNIVAAEKKDSVLPMIIAFAVLLVALWIFRTRGIAYPKAGIIMLLLLAAALRLYLMATQAGYETDMNCWLAWSLRMADVGPNAFYAPDYFCDYPPGYMYLLWATGGVLKLLGVTSLGATGRILVKFVPLVADLGAIFLLWRLARKRLGDMGALLVATLYAMSPAVLMDGAIWGQVDSVLALGLLATVAFALRGNWRAALPVFVVTVLMKPQALMAAPVGVVALAGDMLPWKEKGKKVARDAGIGLGIAVAIAAVMLLPFLWGKEAPISWIIDKYATTLGSYAYATLNTANLYYLLGANWTPLETMLGPLSYGTWGAILMVIVVLGVMALYILRKDKEMLPYFCALIYIGLYLFGVKMHERYLFPAFLLLLYAYARKPDRRLLVMFAGFSVTFYINCAIVLRDTHMPTGFGLAGVLLAIVNIALFGIGVWVAVDRGTRPLPVARARETSSVKAERLQALEGRTEPVRRMARRDWILMLGLTAVYAAVAYIGLGSTVAPQTSWTSTGVGEQVVFDLGEEHEFSMMYYGGINKDMVNVPKKFTLEFSYDGEDWMDIAPLAIPEGDCFRWKFVSQAYYDEEGETSSWSNDPLVCGGRYVRLTAELPATTLMELSFRDLNGTALTAEVISTTGAREESAYDAAMLSDEPDTAPLEPSYYNSTYFDEIYHARTGYEHAHGMQTYEWTHPPLGKVLIMFAVNVFGMTPFGWRFMGALMGVLMVPAMYMLGKLLFKRTRFAFLAAFVMAFDMMHLTQTRIATIDSYAVLCIILMYMFMFRYMQMSFFRDGWRTLIPLGLSGLFMGLGCASKWICMYAGAGLAVLFAWTMVQRFLEWRAAKEAGGQSAEGADQPERELIGALEIEEEPAGNVYAVKAAQYKKYLIGTLAACIVFFIAIPFAIYYFSYIPHFSFEGGLNWQRFWNLQGDIFRYHAGLVDDHAFQSPWYEWPLMLKPMYYYDGKPYVGEGMISTIMCMGNPAVWWAGFAAFLYMLWRWLKPHLLGDAIRDHRPAMLLLAFAAQFLPWVLVPRSTFIYHYFGSLPFVMLALVYGFEQMYERRPARAQAVQIGYMAVVLVLFVGFYPLGSGVQVPKQWADAMNWLRFLKLPNWKFKGWLYY